MNAEEIKSMLSEAEEKLEERDATVFKVKEHPSTGFLFQDMQPIAFIEQGLDIGIDEFYLLETRAEGDNIEQGGICYFYDDRAHTLLLDTDSSTGPSGPENQAGRFGSSIGFGYEESEEEQERKEQVANELLTEYRESIAEDDRFEIENRLDRMNLGRLLRLKQRVEQEAKIDPELEKELARVVYEREEFNQQFNETDTEMLLGQLDIEFDYEKIRTEEVHTRAKSLLKINR